MPLQENKDYQLQEIYTLNPNATPRKCAFCGEPATHFRYLNNTADGMIDMSTKKAVDLKCKDREYVYYDKKEITNTETV